MTTHTLPLVKVSQTALDAAYAAIDRLPLRDFNASGTELDGLRKREGARAAIMAYLSALEPSGEGVGAEPVAWRIRERPGDPWHFTDYDPERMPNVRGFERQPLYAQPLSGMEGAEAAWSAIVSERLRQVSDEGWSAEHDDAHDEGEMLSAAVAYLWHGTHHGTHDGSRPGNWPWDAKWWKPRDRRSNVIRAGALCLAEHDRLIRARKRTGPADHKLGIAIRELVALSTPVSAASPEGEATVPEGFVLVPVEPVMGMFAALTASWPKDDVSKIMTAKWAAGSFREDYQAMLAASPSATQEKNRG